MRFDGHSAVADKQHIAASLHHNRRKDVKYYRLFPDKTETQTVPGNWGQDGTQYETLSDKHVFIVLSFITDSATTIKDPSLSQKGLKVTEWILIKTGVVNSSQHGLQWD